MLNEVVTDLAYFAATLAVQWTIFFMLHVFLFRLTHVKKLATVLNGLITVSVLFTITIAMCVFRENYSSISTCIVSTSGAVLAGVFIIGFYGFAGVIGVDRSPSALMAYTLLQYRKQGLAREELSKLCGHERVIGRRIADFLDARIVAEHKGKLIITRKGASIVRIFLLLNRLLGMGAFKQNADRSTEEEQRPPTYSGNEAEAPRAQEGTWNIGKQQTEGREELTEGRRIGPL
jgi:hypothetical protein